MRRRFDVQLALGQTPIERVRIPLKSRDELPPILAGLQWIFQTPELNEQVFALLESKVIAGKKPLALRRGLDTRSESVAVPLRKKYCGFAHDCPDPNP